MQKRTVYYILLAVSVIVFLGAFVSLSRMTNDAAGDMLSGLQDAASNAYGQQSGLQQPQTQGSFQQPVQQSTQPLPENPVVTPANPQEIPQSTQPQVQANPGVVLQPGASKQDILNAMVTAVNSVKTAQNFAAVKYQNIDMKLTECSMSFAVSIANPIIEKFTGEETLNYQFVNGSCIGPKSGEPVTPNLVIPPSDRLFALDANGVTAATVTQNGYDTTYSISLVPETATLEAPVPYYHGMCMDYLDMNALDLGIAKINKGNYTYPGATVNVTVNQIGQIIRYEEYMPLSAFGEGSLGITASGTISGALHEIWTFTW